MEKSASLIFVLHVKQGWRIIRENVLRYKVEIVKVLHYKLLLEVACPFTEYNVTVLYFQTLYKTLQCCRFISFFFHCFTVHFISQMSHSHQLMHLF